METAANCSQEWLHLMSKTGALRKAPFQQNPASTASQQPQSPSTVQLTCVSGGDEEKAELEARVAAFDTDEYWATHDQRLSVMLSQKNAQDAPAQEPAPIYNMYEDYPSGRHLSETVPEFLARLPPRSTPLSQHGPWIYIASPRYRDVPTSEDLAGFKEVGLQLLDDYIEKKELIEGNLTNKPKSTIDKSVSTAHEKLHTDIYTAARDKGMKSGKWMLFVSAEHVNETWEIIAHAVAEGELGHAAKVAANDGSGNQRSRLISVYTLDFADEQDVKRVLQRLGTMDFMTIRGKARAIYYKADCYTHLDIMSGNKWGLKPTLYSSADVLKRKKG